ncbi:ATP-binding protein [Streptomyces avicenniae]|uniref:ATP-binding protein n=1 Tax=Streptomyces avicenniae TaxID=500153 RepID=UPI00069CBD67|nr:ATP-binding protein [Streptomyces avicenniae]
MGTDGTPVLMPSGHPLPPVDPRTVSSTASLALSGRPESVRRARDFTRETLRAWRLPQQCEPVGLVVSELVTNALRHGLRALPPVPRAVPVPMPPETRTRTVGLELMRCAGRLVCAVQDPSGHAPRVGELDGATESGRGLRLVECFSDGWGWRPLTGGQQGKIVWAVFGTA